MKLKQFLIPLFFLPLTFQLFAQDNFQSGGALKVGLSTVLKSDWKLSTLYSGEHLFYEQTGETGNNEYLHKKSDFQLILKRKTSYGALFAGYSYDIVKHKHSLFQQYSINQQGFFNIYSHRIQLKEKLYKGIIDEYSLGYRLGITKPLGKSKIQNRTYYLKLTIENSAVLKERQVNWTNSDALYLGYYYSNQNKIEIGTIFKGEKLLNTDKKYRLWLSCNWYLGINTKKKK